MFNAQEKTVPTRATTCRLCSELSKVRRENLRGIPCGRRCDYATNQAHTQTKQHIVPYLVPRHTRHCQGDQEGLAATCCGVWSGVSPKLASDALHSQGQSSTLRCSEHSCKGSEKDGWGWFIGDVRF